MVEISRAQISIPRFDDCGYVDVTIKSATGTAKLFAPTWDMVMGHKSGSLSDLDYTTQYLQILNTIDQDAWEWLADQAINNQLVVMCYCFSPNFCHTNILVDYASSRHPHLFFK